MIVKEKNGTYTVRLSKRINGERIQKTKRGFSKKRDAEKYEATMKAEDISGTNLTFEEALEAYLIYSDASPTSAYLKRTFVRRHFPLRTERIDKITKEMLVEWRNALKSSGLAVRTANRGMGYIKSVFNYVNEIYGVKNMATIIKPYKLSKQDKQEMKTWSPSEFNQFIEAVPEGFYKAFFTFLFWTGCRRSEGLAVCKDDFDGNTVHIWRSIKHFQNGFLPLKTDSSERYVTLDTKTYEYLKPYIEKANPFVFGGIRSLPISCIQREFKNAIQKSGVKEIRIHDLRHSHASYLLGNNVPPVAVSKRLGHASTTQTLSTYAHLLPKPHDEMMLKIDSLRQKENV